MANANAPRGLVPYCDTNGRLWTGAANLYYIPSTVAVNLFIGDPVLVTGGADANGIPAVDIATAGATNYITGPIVSIVNGGSPQLAPIPVTQGLPPYHPASTAQYILVADDPNLLFSIQEDSVGGAMAAGAAMANADLVAGAGSTTTSQSGWMLDSSTVGTGSTLQMRVLRLLQQSDNIIGAYAKWLVRMNLCSQSNPTGV